MNMMRLKAITALFLLFLTFSAFAGPGIEEPRPGEALYLIVLGDRAEELDVAAIGGRVVQSWSDRRLVTVPEERAGALREHEGIVYVQRIWTAGAQRSPEPMPALTSITSAAVAPPWTTGVYRYDPSGNVKSMGSDTFGYDAVSRILQANIKGTPQTFEYDPYGNLRRLGGIAMNPDAATNRIPVYEYDTAGYVIQDEAGRRFHYDATGMVSAVDSVATDTIGHDRRMIYSADDERIVVAEGGSTMRYRVRDFGARVLREWKSTGTILEWERDYIYAGGDLVAGEVQIDQRQNGQRHYHTDHLGSVRMVTDGAADLVSRHDYLPFGDELPPTTTEWTNTAKGPRDPKKFTGHERDYFSSANLEGAALDYMHARYYAPGRGRFLSIDPTWESADLVKPQTWNRYAYVLNNPVNLTDPDGKCPFICQLGVELAIDFVTDGNPTGSADLPKDPAQRAAHAREMQAWRLEQRAKEIHSALPEATQRRTTTAVAEVTNPDGTKQILVASSEKNLRPAQRAALRPGEVAVSGKGHAEQTIIDAAKKSGQTVDAVAASRPICSSCATRIWSVGARWASKLKDLEIKKLLKEIF
jgi:RHS repeat-associated protein